MPEVPVLVVKSHNLEFKELGLPSRPKWANVLEVLQ